MSDTPEDRDALIAAIIPAAKIEKLELGRVEEILQPLMDLGYISKADTRLIPMAIRLFRKDYLELNLIPEFKPKFWLSHGIDLESEELSLLHTLISLDGDFSIDLLPKPGTVNLLSRVLHYRLSIHHFYALPIDSPFSRISLNAINKLKHWVKNLPKADLEMVNLLGDIPALVQHIEKNANGGLNKRIVVFKYQKVKVFTRFSVPVPNELMEEVVEDEEDDEKDNEAAMLKAETEIDETLNKLQSTHGDIFKQDEQEELKDSRKNRRRRKQIVRISGMMNQILAEMHGISDAASEAGATIPESIQRLKGIRNTLNNEHKSLKKQISTVEDAIKRLEKNKKKLNKKERQLHRKIKKNAPQSEIRQLKLEITAIKNADRTIEQLEIKKSPFQVQSIHIEAELKNVNKKINALQNRFDNILKKRKEEIEKRQGELKELHDQLKILQGRVEKIKFSFRGKMKKVLDRRYYEEVIKKEVFEKRNRQFLEEVSQDPFVIYLTRLIQIFQWTNGFYYGKIDNEIGDRTFNALDNMSTYSRGLRLKFILTRLSENHEGTRGFWILNIKYLFARLSQIIAEQSDITTVNVLEEYENRFIKNKSSDTSIGNEVTDRAYSEIVEENQSDIRETGIIRRIYYGIKSIANTIFNALKELINILRSAIQELIYLVKNLVKIVYKEIREGMRKFKEGMQFLFGRREFETPTAKGSAILTKYDFDFDTLMLVPEEVSDVELRQHTAILYRFSNNLDFALVLTGNILKWVFRLINLGTPIGWARLAIRVAIRYKGMIIKWLVRLGRKLTQTFVSIKHDLGKLSNPQPA